MPRKIVLRLASRNSRQKVIMVNYLHIVPCTVFETLLIISITWILSHLEILMNGSFKGSGKLCMFENFPR